MFNNARNGQRPEAIQEPSPWITRPRPSRTQNWLLTKPSATGKRGMVVSQVRSAAEAGVAILDAGGNAIDAAVGTALALAALEPWNSGLGGIGFALVHRAGERRADVVDFGPVAPRGLNPSSFKLTGKMSHGQFAWAEVEGDANIHGPLSVAIPSSTAGYAKMHQTWGKLPFADVIAPAIALAKRGLPQDWYTTLKSAAGASVFRNYAESARVYLPDGLPRVPPYQAAHSGYLPSRQPAGDIGTAGASRPARLLRGRHRRHHRLRYQSAWRRAVGPGSAGLSGADFASLVESPKTWRGRTLQMAGGLDRLANDDARVGSNGSEVRLRQAAPGRRLVRCLWRAR